MTKITVPLRLLKISDSTNRGFIEEWYAIQAENVTPEDAYEQLESLREQYGMQRRYNSFSSFQRVLRKRYFILKRAGKSHLV